MLKLEKTSPFSPLTYRLRERERRIEPLLLKAFAIAFFLHAGFFLLFQINPFSLSSSFLFPPIQVQSGPFPVLTNAWSSTERQDEEDELFPSISLIPPLTWEKISLDGERALNLHAFQHLEEQMWPMEFAPLSLPLEEHKIELSLSGDLAERALIQTDARLLQTQPLSFRTPLLISYQVEMDERSGEIFWYERTQSSGKKELDDLTEEILLNLRFSTNNKEMAGGQVQFKVFEGKE